MNITSVNMKEVTKEIKMIYTTKSILQDKIKDLVKSKNKRK